MAKRKAKMCLCGSTGQLGRPRKRKTARMGVAKRCKLIRTRSGAVIKGCYNAKGQFRFQKA